MNLFAMLLAGLAIIGWSARESDGQPASLPEALEGGRRKARGLVVVLHGGSWRPRTSEELARRALEALDRTADKVGLRLVAPTLPGGATAPLASSAGGQRVQAAPAGVPWLAPDAVWLIRALINQEVERGRADPRRVYLAGHGAGATAALHLAARDPDSVAAVALWSGTPSPIWTFEPEPDAGAGPASERSPVVLGLLDEPVPALRTVPVYLWTGDQDDVLDRDTLDVFVRQMRASEELGLGHRLLWERGRGRHDYGVDGPESGLRFLKQHRKQRRP